jgi:hypothetical protein
MKLDACSPWDRWVLVALHRHVARQRFVEQIVREHLSGSPEALAEAGSFGHPTQIPGTGEVPGLPEWCYRFHGRGCCLNHPDGTVLDVDFDEHGSTSIDPSFYQRFLESAPNLGWLESLLRATDGGWKASIHPLCGAGLLDREYRVRVVPHARDWCEAISQAVDRADDSDAQRCAVALAVEDFPLAAKLDPSIAPERHAAARRQIEDRCRELEARISGRVGPYVESCLAALASLDADRARSAALAELQQGPIDVVASASMNLLAANPHPGDIPIVRGLLARLRGVDPPAPWLRLRGVQHLLAPYRRATVPEHVREWVLDVLAEDQRAQEGEAALLVYLVDTTRGRARMERGLQSPIPLARGQCAAALDLINGDEAAASWFSRWFREQYEPLLRDWEADE